jgi:hypothetical protein
MTFTHNKTLIVLVALLSTSASQNPKSKTLNEFEKTIDRFEAEMMRRDRESFTVGTDGKDSNISDDPIADVQGKGMQIESAIPGGKELENIGLALTRIDNDIESLTKDVEAFKAKAFQTSTVGNLIDIEVSLNNPEKSRLKSLTVKLDGYELYSINDSNNLPLPATVVPVFSGPLQPGTHKLEVEARIAMSDSNSSIPLNSFAYKHSTTQLDLPVSDGKYSKRVVIALQTPTDAKDSLKIVLEPGPETTNAEIKEASR